MNKPTQKNIFVSVLLVSALSACSTSPTPRLYIIEPMAAFAGTTSTQIDKGLSIGVGPVTLPEHLNRKEIVTHDQRFRVKSAEFDRWAEPLDDNINRALCENLSVLIPSNHVIAYPRRTAQYVNYTVWVRVITFGTSPGGKVVLSAAWVLHDTADIPVKATKTRYSVPRRGDDVVALVEAMSQVLEQLSRDIADAINEASTNPKPD